jgi:hypothetical protein
MTRARANNQEHVAVFLETLGWPPGAAKDAHRIVARVHVFDISVALGSIENRTEYGHLFNIRRLSFSLFCLPDAHTIQIIVVRTIRYKVTENIHSIDCIDRTSDATGCSKEMLRSNTLVLSF